ncbi:MAG TPA: hypothetical protein VM864_16760 [Pyrinomonadaceae bacterium]|jgi:hypothetical protein|nr:hypothetical protein [Pyrinomonadaceae bacterium]
MKFTGALLLFLSLAVISQAQTPPAGPQGPPDLAVVKFSWSKERVNWERDPFGGPVENFDDMRVRTRNDRRLEVNKGSVEEDRVRREVKADAANQQLLRQQQGPARYVFMYKASVRNDGAKAITEIDWDYIFFDKDTETERGRHRFTSAEKIGAGKSKQLTFTVTRPPTQTISARVLDDKERQNLGERVVIMRILYADGTTWQSPQP